MSWLGNDIDLFDRESMHRRAVRRWRIFGGLFLIYLGYAFVPLWRDHSVPTAAAGTGLLIAFVGLYLGAVPVSIVRSRRQRAVVLGAMVVVAIGLYVLGGDVGLLTSTYLCAATIMLAPRRAAVAVTIGLTVFVVVAAQYVPGLDVQGWQVALGAPVILVSLAMFGVRAGFMGADALVEARRQAEEMAAERERLRISRDLHDLLGHSLTTMTLKADLAARLVERDPERATREIREVAELSRQSLADVRAAVSGFREVSIASELARAREVLRAADITADFPPTADDVPVPRRELFGWVVREGVTNVVRHSRATRVGIALTAECIEVVDDGLGAAATDGHGHGLRGLSERVEAAGAHLVSGPIVGARGYRLSVTFPTERGPR